MKLYLAYTRPLEVDWLLEGCVRWCTCNDATGEVSAAPLCSICGEKWAGDGSFITSMVGEVLVRFWKARLMKMFEAHSAADPAGVHLDEPASLHPNNVFKRGDDRDGGYRQPIWDLQSISDQSAVVASAPQQIQ